MKLCTTLLALAFAAGVSAQVVYTDNAWHSNELVYASNNNKTIAEPTAFRVHNTETAFDIEIKLEGSHWKKLQAVPFKMQPVKWPEEESVELFFDPGRSCSKYQQIAAGVNGGVFDKRFREKEWQAKWTVTREDFEGGVTLKFHIPYDSEFKKPAKGEIWGFNVCRNVKNDTPYYSTFAKVGAAFHNPSKFAELRFGTQKEFSAAALQKNLAQLQEVRKEIDRYGWNQRFAARISKLEKECTELDIRYLQDELRILKAMKEISK